MNDLVRMSNDIAAFFSSYPPEEGKQMISEHINKFWAPSMRSRFLEMIETDAGAFHPLVVESAGMVRCVHKNPVSITDMDFTGTGG